MQPVLFFEPGPFPGLSGPAVGPKGPKIGQKSRGRIYHFILHKVCPVRGMGALYDGMEVELMA